jgi:hypothetical protein
MVKINQFEIAIEYEEAEWKLEGYRAEIESYIQGWETITSIDMMNVIQDFVGVTQERMVVKKVAE